MILHLGVIDIPYGDLTEAPALKVQRAVAKPSKGGRRAPKKPKKAEDHSAATTYEVAVKLEAKYHIMEEFFGLYEKPIEGHVEQGLGDAIEAIGMGAPTTLDPYGAATSLIEKDFRFFLDRSELAFLVPGVPTLAAQRGVNHRLKLKQGPPRPSFIDTGLYQASFKAWVD